jgi:hypothetical protein
MVNIRRGLQSRRLLLPVLAAGLALPVSTSHASVIVIDDFSDAPGAWPISLFAPGTTSLTEAGLTGVLGGVRETTVSMTSAANPGLDFLQATIAPALGLFDYNSSAGTDGSVSFLYDAGGAGLSAFFANQLGIEIGFTLFDHAGGVPLPVTIVLTDGMNTATLTQSLTAPGGQTLQFLFADFANIGALGLAYVQSVEVILDAAIGADFRVSQISTIVPAPGSIALLALAAFVGRFRRRT